MNIAGVLVHSGGGVSRARSAQKLRFEANRIYRPSIWGVSILEWAHWKPTPGEFPSGDELPDRQVCQLNPMREQIEGWAGDRGLGWRSRAGLEEGKLKNRNNLLPGIDRLLGLAPSGGL
ncbi:MAG: hypothetical protein ACPGLY_22980 [Rubripirellula sp.]